MEILHVASEVAPLIKTGGLADVVGSLPAAQRALGHKVSVLVPGYPAVLERAGDLQRLPGFDFGALGGAGLLCGELAGGVDLLVLDHHDYFDRPGNPYLAADGREWKDNPIRFALLGRVGAELARATLAVDIVHMHDWHAGLTMAYLEALGRGPSSCFTIHNLAFQGNYSWSDFVGTGLPESLYRFEGIEYHGGWSFMKAGLSYCDAITTVSPTYAREILTAEVGMGLDGMLNYRHADLHGILNGVDYSVWSPSVDTALPQRYDADSLHGKSANKAGLQEALGLAVEATRPLVGVVSRLTRQKGFDFAQDALATKLAKGSLQLILLGTGDADIEAGFAGLANRFPDICAVNIGYDEIAAHRIFGAADAILVPSLFEPCGLTQMYGLRYGTLPLVRNTGGLADTVRGYSGRNAEDATGFRFNTPNATAVGRMLGRACRLFGDRATWRQLMRNAMAQDFSWARSAVAYLDLYQKLLHQKLPRS